MLEVCTKTGGSSPRSHGCGGGSIGPENFGIGLGTSAVDEGSSLHQLMVFSRTAGEGEISPSAKR